MTTKYVIDHYGFDDLEEVAEHVTVLSYPDKISDCTAWDVRLAKPLVLDTEKLITSVLEEIDCACDVHEDVDQPSSVFTYKEMQPLEEWFKFAIEKIKARYFIAGDPISAEEVDELNKIIRHCCPVGRVVSCHRLNSYRCVLCPFN